VSDAETVLLPDYCTVIIYLLSVLYYQLSTCRLWMEDTLWDANWDESVTWDADCWVKWEGWWSKAISEGWWGL